MKNSECDWGKFDPAEYAQREYGATYTDMREVTRIVAGHFRNCSIGGKRHGLGLDVGSGGNMIPLLTQIPWCCRMILTDSTERAAEWAVRTAHDLPDMWKMHWGTVQAANVPGTWDEIKRKAGSVLPHPDAMGNTVDGSVQPLYTLPSGVFDMGTMFFVAETITGDEEELYEGVKAFVDSLKIGAPYAMAFHAEIDCWESGNIRFPAVNVSEASVCEALYYADQNEYMTRRIKPSDGIVRPGHDRGIILVTGVKNGRM